MFAGVLSNVFNWFDVQCRNEETRQEVCIEMIAQDQTGCTPLRKSEQTVNTICKDCLTCFATTCMIGVRTWIIEELYTSLWKEVVVQNDMNIRNCPTVLRWTSKTSSLFTIFDHCSGHFATLGYSDEYLMNGTLGWFGLACSVGRNAGGLCANILTASQQGAARGPFP